jgi:hypothetical protein
VIFSYSTPMTLVSRVVTGRNGDGNDVYQETTATVLGALDPGGSTEVVQGRDTVITLPRAFLPPGTVVNPTDAIRVGGVTYEVTGSANSWTSPFSGGALGVVVNLRGVTG